MKIETTFNNGDRAWASNGGQPHRVTIGQVRVQITETPGINGGYVEPEAPNVCFSNFAPESERLEQYMAIETGIGSGSVYTLGVNIFETEAEAQAAILELTKGAQ